MRESKQVVSTTDAPAAIGPYSQAIVANGLVFTAGQIPVDPANGAVVDGGIEAQTERVMRNLANVLAAAGTSLESAVKTTCFLTDLADFPAFNKIYGSWMPEMAPARSTVEVSRLPLGVLVEVECVAIVGAAGE